MQNVSKSARRISLAFPTFPVHLPRFHVTFDPLPTSHSCFPPRRLVDVSPRRDLRVGSTHQKNSNNFKRPKFSQLQISICATSTGHSWPQLHSHPVRHVRLTVPISGSTHTTLDDSSRHSDSKHHYRKKVGSIRRAAGGTVHWFYLHEPNLWVYLRKQL